MKKSLSQKSDFFKVLNIKKVIKVKKSFSIFIILFLILGNISLAQSVDDIGTKEKDRKDAFSYENKDYQPGYDAGPSYEGYSKEYIILGMIFEQIGKDIDPREIKQYCNDTDKIADIVISKFKEKFGDLQKICAQIEERESKCSESSDKSCSHIGGHEIKENATELEKIQYMAYSCPPNRDAMSQACKIRIKNYMEQRATHSDQSCEERFSIEGEKLIRECEKFKEHQICDKDKFIDRCTSGIKRDGSGISNPSSICGNGICERDESGYCPSCVNDKIHPCKIACRAGTCPQDCNKKECKSDDDCPIINCLKITDCPKYTCINGQCSFEKPKSCGNNICEEGEAEYCPPCTKANPPCDARCQIGTCPQDCQKKCDEELCKQYICCDPSRGQCPLDCPQGVDCPHLPSQCASCTKDICSSDKICPQDAKQCSDGTFVSRVSPNCDFKSCPDTANSSDLNSCPEYAMPLCSSDTALQKKTDERGCVYYYCETFNAGISNTGTSTSTGSVIKVTGNAALTTDEDFLRHCEDNWVRQEKMCSQAPNNCDKASFIDKCREKENQNSGDMTQKIEQSCESQVNSQMRSVEQRCAHADSDKQHCIEQSSRRCEQIKGMAQHCREILTEEKLRSFIVDEANKKCRFNGIIEHEDDVRGAGKVDVILAVSNTANKEDLTKLGLFVNDLKEELKLQETTVYKGTIDPKNFGDIKLLPFVVNAKISTFRSSETAKNVKESIVAKQKTEDSVSKLISLRDSNIPNQYLYVIEDKASEILNASDKVAEIGKKEEQKGFGYKMKLFFGLARKAEQEEINQLEDSKTKLNSSIEALAKLADEVPNDLAKAILKEQVESLKKQQQDIELLVKTKQKKSKGLLGLFG